MAVYNLEALALRTKYLMSTEGLAQQEAEQRVFQESGISDLSPEMRAEYDRLLNEGTQNNEFSRNDGQRIIDRRATTDYRTYGRASEQTPPPPQEPTDEPL